MTTPPDLAAAAERRRQQQSQALWPGDHVRVCDTSTYFPSPTTTPGAASGVSSKSTLTVRTGRAGRGRPTRRSSRRPRNRSPRRTRQPCPTASPPGRPARHPRRRRPPRPGHHLSNLLVALVDKGDKINAARLGGDNGRYWRLPRAMLAEIVDPATVLNPDATR